MTKTDMVAVFAQGLNVISRFESIDAAYTAESVGDGAELDYKFTVYSILGIESNSLIVIDGITYNANEAGNFLWAAVNEYADEVTDLTALYDPSCAAQFKTLSGQTRFDETHEQKALDDGENYGIKMSDDIDFNESVNAKVTDKELFDDSYLKDKDE